MEKKNREVIRVAFIRLPEILYLLLHQITKNNKRIITVEAIGTMTATTGNFWLLTLSVIVP